MDFSLKGILGIGSTPKAPPPPPPLPTPPPPPPPPPAEMKLPANTALPPAQTDKQAALDKAHGLWNLPGEQVRATNLTIDGKSLNIAAPGARAEIATAEAEAAALEAQGKKAEAKALRQGIQEFRKQFEAQDLGCLMATFENRDLEKAELAKLKPEQQAQYAQLSHWFENDPQARLGLQTLLLSGKLTQEPKNKDGKDLLGALTEMAKTPVKAPLNPGSMLGETVREIANPSSIRQANKNTCSAASLAIMTATERPAEYARLLTGLAKDGDGKVALPNGQELARVPGSETNQDPYRTGTQELWQAAFMQYEAKQIDPRASYDPRTDTITWGDRSTSNSGIVAAGMLAGMKAITGDGATQQDQLGTSTKALNQAIAQLRTTPGTPIPITLGAKYDKDGTPGGTVQAQIKAFDPQTQTFQVVEGGKTKTMTADELLGRTQKLALPNGTAFDREAETDKMFALIEQGLADEGKNQSRPIAMLRQGAFQGAKGVTGDGGGEINHYVTVTKVKDGQVYYLNSLGSEEHMPVAAFKNRLSNATAGAPKA